MNTLYVTDNEVFLVQNDTPDKKVSLFKSNNEIFVVTEEDEVFKIIPSCRHDEFISELQSLVTVVELDFVPAFNGEIEILVPKDKNISIKEFLTTDHSPLYRNDYQNIRYKFDELRIGIEFEIPRYERYDFVANKYLNTLIRKYRFLIERDGSIPDGIELKLENPVSIRRARKILTSLALFRRQFYYMFRSKRKSGLHLHMNISNLNSHDITEVKFTMRKIAMELEEDERIFRLFGRLFNKYCRECSNESRYEWINLKNSTTIEFRLGNSKRNSYLKFFNFSLMMFKKALSVSRNECSLEEAIEYLKKKLDILITNKTLVHT